jgi:DNA-binding XRE family transcriptional regulator
MTDRIACAVYRRLLIEPQPGEYAGRRVACSFEVQRLGANIGGKISDPFRGRKRPCPSRADAILNSSLVNKAVKRAKPKKVSPRAASAVDKYIGARMREQRLALSMSQELLSKHLGVSFQQIQKYESGRNRVSAARLFDICKVLNVSLSSMFEREPKARDPLLVQ